MSNNGIKVFPLHHYKLFYTVR